MDLMVNPVITDFQQDVNGDIKMLKLGTDKQDAWANIAEQGGSAKLDNNKAATINVSTYTEPVVITPTSGKDGMKKATITLSNIPSGSATVYVWIHGERESEFYIGTNFSTAPEELPQGAKMINNSLLQDIPNTYTYINDNQFEIAGALFTRSSSNDYSIW